MMKKNGNSDRQQVGNLAPTGRPPFALGGIPPCAMCARVHVLKIRAENAEMRLDYCVHENMIGR